MKERYERSKLFSQNQERIVKYEETGKRNRERLKKKER